MLSLLGCGKKSSHEMKVVTVKLFNRDAEGGGHHGVKNSKASVLLTF